MTSGSTHLLVVDDDRAVRLHVSRQLQQYQYQVTVAADGREALSLLQSQPFDLVLLDVIMPILDGYAVLTQLKSDPHLNALPIIMISAMDDLERAISCIEQGAEDYLAKPLNPVLLKARINASLERKRLRTQEQAYLKQLQTEKLASEAAHRAKSAFLANMSHELRTPLNAIIGYSEMLQEDLQADGILDYLSDLQKIHKSGKHLLHLVDSILDLAKIEAGKMDLCIEPIELSALINQIVEAVQPMLTAKGNLLKTTSPANVSTFSTDPNKLHQILLNLLSNANKFMEKGTITLSVETRSHNEAPYFEPAPQIVSPSVINSNIQQWLIFKVTDTGIGMTQTQMERIFQAFTQADDSTTRKYDGAGLGLTIARRFCQLMGGDITVESVLHEGSTFAVWLPMLETS